MNHLRSTPIEHSPLAQRASSRLAMFNVVLGGISLLLIGYYVVQNNDMAVQVWRARDAQTQLSELREERNELVANRASLDDRQQLTSLAVSAGMVPAGTVVYLVQDQPVAVR